ncbi:MAG: biopolymer transporter ExbD [Nannocystaceae bacterium]|nr:biopolymer transporter ExbD [Nannocystaceae bacterium]
MSASSSPSEGINAINITPMVDIILVLLVIFMVTTSAINQVESMEVNRPDAATGLNSATDKGQILLTCMADGVLSVDGVVVTTDEQILGAIAAKKAEHPKLQGVISCDEDAAVRSLVRLLDLLRQSGVTKYAIATEQPHQAQG